MNRRRAFLAVLSVLVVGSIAPAQEPRKPVVRNYTSQNFLVHSDCSPQEAKELLERLETMLGLVSNYWGRPVHGIIECYVIKELSNWPKGSLHPEGLASVSSGGGITIGITLGGRGKSVVFAPLERGVPQHESVHAYCQQTFGRTGPTWYAEGMAELGQYWRKDQFDVQIETGVLRYLQQSKPKSMAEIIEPGQVTGDSWQAYSWRWALCHLLEHNPNYRARFRPLGLGILTGQPVSFEQTYGAMADEISFEYLFFLEHLDQGLRSDLIAWDWRKKFFPLANDKRVFSARVQARRGWQPSGLEVKAGHEYGISAKGEWKISEDADKVTADGDDDGNGRLVGILMKDWKLGEPFELGSEGTFVAPADGKLYLRASDAWTELDDNNGQVTVKLSFVSESPTSTEPLYRPAQPKETVARSPSEDLTRTWTDASGKYSIKAALVRFQGGNVTLKRDDGREVTLPLAKLSKEDQAFVRESGGQASAP